MAKERRYVGKMNELRGFGCKRTQEERAGRWQSQGKVMVMKMVQFQTELNITS